MSSLHTASSSEEFLSVDHLLEVAIEALADTLFSFASDGDATLFGDRLSIALGFDLDRSVTDALYQKIAEGTYTLPTIEVLSLEELKGAPVAYSSLTETIYLSDELFHTNRDRILSTLLEGIGYILDTPLTTAATPGNEGATFPTIVRDTLLTEERLEELRSAIDMDVAMVHGKELPIEHPSTWVEPAPIPVDPTIDIGIDKNFIGLDSFVFDEEPTPESVATKVIAPEEGETVSFELVVTNHGTADAHQVQITDHLDDRLALDSIFIDGETPLTNYGTDQNLDFTISLAAGETRTITVNTLVDFDDADELQALNFSSTFGDNNADLREYQDQTVNGAIYVSNTDFDKHAGSTVITFNPFLEVTNTATATLLDKGIRDTDHSNNSDTDDFSFLRLSLDGTLSDGETPITIASLGSIEFDLDPQVSSTAQGSSGRSTTRVRNSSDFLNTAEGDVGAAEFDLFFDLSGEDLTFFEHATGDDAFGEFIRLIEADTYAGEQFSQDNPKNPHEISSIELTRLLDVGETQSVAHTQSLEIEAAEVISLKPVIDIGIDKNFIGLDSFVFDEEPTSESVATKVIAPEEGETVSFELVVTNHGTADAHQVKITDHLDDRLALDSIFIDGETPLTNHGTDQNLDFTISLAAGETRTITVNTLIDFEAGDELQALSFLNTFGDNNPDLNEYENQTVNGAIYISNTDFDKHAGSTVITFNPFLEVVNTATATLLDEGIHDIDHSNNSDTDDFSFLRLSLDGTLSDGETPITIASLGSIEFDLNPQVSSTAQGSSGRSTTRVRNSSDFLNTAEGDVGAAEFNLFFDLLGEDLTFFEHATGDDAFDEFIRLIEAGTYASGQFSQDNPKNPHEISSIELTRLLDVGETQSVAHTQSLEVDTAELIFPESGPTQLTNTGWQKAGVILGEWSPDSDLVFDLVDGIAVASHVVADTLEGDDVIKGAVTEGIGFNNQGTLKLNAGNDVVSGDVFAKGDSDNNIGVNNQASLFGGLGDNSILGTVTVGGSGNHNIGFYSHSLDKSGNLKTENGSDLILGDVFVGGNGDGNIGIDNDAYLNTGSLHDDVIGTVTVAGNGSNNIGIRFNNLSEHSSADTGTSDDSVTGQVTIESNGSDNIGIENRSELNTGTNNDAVSGIVTVAGTGTNNIGLLNQGYLNTSSGNDMIRGEVQGDGFGLVNHGSIVSYTGADIITGLVTGNGFGIKNTSTIDLGLAWDTIIAEGADAFSGFTGGGTIDLGTGHDQIIGFGDQIVHGGYGLDEAVFGFALDDAITLGSSDSTAVDITANGVTMSFTDVERFTFTNGVYTLGELTSLAAS